MRDAEFIFQIDSPEKNAVIKEPFIWLRGWVALENPFDSISFTLQTESQDINIDINLERRQDVKQAHSDKYSIGFNHFFSHNDIDPVLSYFIQFKTNDEQSGEIPIKFKLDKKSHNEFIHFKDYKLKQIKDLIACPVCKDSPVKTVKNQIICQNCNMIYSLNQNHYCFKNAPKAELPIYSSANVSSNFYDNQALNLINKYKKQLILDNGSGLRDTYYKNIINLEIEDFPTTDVVGSCDNLPFRSESFDVVFSFAVLEHVKDPFKCASEIERVLKPGGMFYVAVPFLQPFHAYPDHYYNMTLNGLKNLFSEKSSIIDSGVPKSGLPVWALNWFLNSYVKGLPIGVRERFLNMQVKDFLDDPRSYYKENFVRKLNPESIQELACVNYVIGKKK
ncbi:class I SAM-dependent methyltransferase [candidate division KSB1 bacterium]